MIQNLKEELQHTKSQLAMVTGLLVIGYIFDWQVLILAATALAVIFLLVPFLGKAIAKAWMKLAMFLGHWNGRILLTLVFFLFLTPLAFLYRLFGKGKKENKVDANSNYVIRNHTYTAEDLDKMW